MYTSRLGSCAWVRGGVMVPSVQRLTTHHKQWVWPPRSHANKSPPRTAVHDLLLAVAKPCAVLRPTRLTFKSRPVRWRQRDSRQADASPLQLRCTVDRLGRGSAILERLRAAASPRMARPISGVALLPWPLESSTLELHPSSPGAASPAAPAPAARCLAPLGGWGVSGGGSIALSGSLPLGRGSPTQVTRL